MMQGTKARFARLAATNVGFCHVSQFGKIVLTDGQIITAISDGLLGEIKKRL